MKERALKYGLFWVCVNGCVTREHHQAWQKNVMVSSEVNAFVRWVCVSSSWGLGQRCMKKSWLICYWFSPLSSLEMDLTIRCHITHIAYWVLYSSLEIKGSLHVLKHRPPPSKEPSPACDIWPKMGPCLIKVKAIVFSALWVVHEGFGQL